MAAATLIYYRAGYLVAAQIVAYYICTTYLSTTYLSTTFRIQYAYKTYCAKHDKEKGYAHSGVYSRQYRLPLYLPLMVEDLSTKLGFISRLKAVVLFLLIDNYQITFHIR